MIGFVLAALLATTSPKCRGCAVEERPQERNLLVFVSFSVPLESWKEYSAQLTQAGGTFVLRGIPDNSFLEFGEKLEALRSAGVTAAIDIDPGLFEAYGIESVPAIVVREGEKRDKVIGNFQLVPFLEESASSGDAKSTSADKLRSLK